MSDLRREQDTFDRLRDQMLKEHRNKFVTIHGEEVVGIYPSYNEALRQALDRFGIDVKVLIRQIRPEETESVISLVWPESLLAQS